MTDINSMRADLVAISPQSPDHSLSLKNAKNLTFEILSDPGNRVAEKFRLVHTLPEDLRKIYLKFRIDLPKYNGDDSWRLPLASRFIIDREGVIRYAEMDVDHTNRPDAEHTLEALETIK